MFPKRKANFQVTDENVQVDVVTPSMEKVEMPILKESEPLPAIIESVEVKKERAAVSPQAVPETPPGSTPADLERLREILYGSQARTTEKRITDLENRLIMLRQEMNDLLEKRFNSVAHDASSQVNSTNKELSERLTQVSTEQSAQLRGVQQTLENQLQKQETDLNTQIRTTRRELSERLEALQTEQATQLRDVQRELNQRIDTLTSDFFAQLRQMQKELSERLDQINNAQSERTQTLQQESRQRDDTLRQELILLASQLDDRKVSRLDLGQLLVEMGQRLRSDKQ